MTRSYQTLAILVVATLLVPAGILLDASTAEAQAVKRSAGSKRTGSTSSARRGGGSVSRSSRSSRGPVLPSEQKQWEYEDEKKDRYYGSGSGKSYDDGDDEIEPDAAPTLGRACIYGEGDKVVYRPRGARCRGDAPLAREARPRRPEPAAAPAAPARRPAASAFRPSDRPRKKKVRRKTSAGCLYKADGVVLYGPDTSDCVNGIGAPANARIAPAASAASTAGQTAGQTADSGTDEVSSNTAE